MNGARDSVPNQPGTPHRPADLTRFLRRLGQEPEALSAALMPHVYAELKAIAQSCLRSQRARHTLHPTALVNEAYLKLFDQAELDLHDRSHFFALAAKAMRQLVVDHARARGRQKRGGDRREVTLGEAVAQAGQIDFDLIDLDRALDQLSRVSERQGRIVELRYFAGLEVEQVAQVMDISKTTVEREWRVARAWLGQRLSQAAD